MAGVRAQASMLGAPQPSLGATAGFLEGPMGPAAPATAVPSASLMGLAAPGIKAEAIAEPGSSGASKVRNSAAAQPLDTTLPPLPPLTPNEFQRFVQANTGRVLPLFGSNLFERAPGSFVPSESVPVPADYVIGPGDQLLVRASGLLEFELWPTVDRDGRIVIPKVGAVSVAGVKRGELEAHLTRELNRRFKNFTLSASLGALRSIDVYVTGQARRPGKYTVSGLSTLLNVLFTSGGPNAQGSMRRVSLVRDSQMIASFDLYEFIARGDTHQDRRLLPGDVIVFPSAGPRVAVLGALDVPAVYELAGSDASIADVLALSGGLPALARPQRAQLERIDAHVEVARSLKVLALDEVGLKERLRDGDVLTLLPLSPQFAKVVTLRGNVAAPLRYPFKPGMRVRDLIPAPEALITPDYYVRKNLLVQFEGSGPNGPAASAAAGRGADDEPVTVETTRRDIQHRLDEVNWDYAVIERLDGTALKTQLIPFNLGQVVLHNDPQHNLTLQAGDIVTVFSRRDLQLPQTKQNRLVRVEGEVAAPGIYAAAPGETLPELITRVGGLTPQAYLFGTGLTRVSVQRAQQVNLQAVVKRLEDQIESELGTKQASTAQDAASAAAQQGRLALEERRARQRLQSLRAMKPSGRVALEMDVAAPELPPVQLEDGDQILVPARPSFVSVMGAVFNENALIWRDARSVADYLAAAGPTPSADLDSVFVLRADGSIASAQQRGWWQRGLMSLNLAPGDTVVVPEKVDRETRYAAFMRGLKDWTQVIYQLGLGAAAIKVLRN